MVTGDHPITAKSIARMVGIITPGETLKCFWMELLISLVSITFLFPKLHYSFLK